jgi:hypothetical protein
MVLLTLPPRSLSNSASKFAAAVPAQHSSRLSQCNTHPKVSSPLNSGQLIHGLHGAYFSLLPF